MWIGGRVRRREGELASGVREPENRPKFLSYARLRVMLGGTVIARLTYAFWSINPSIRRCMYHPEDTFKCHSSATACREILTNVVHQTTIVLNHSHYIIFLNI